MLIFPHRKYFSCVRNWWNIHMSEFHFEFFSVKLQWKYVFPRKAYFLLAVYTCHFIWLKFYKQKYYYLFSNKKYFLFVTLLVMPFLVFIWSGDLQLHSIIFLSRYLNVASHTSICFWRSGNKRNELCKCLF